MKFLCVPCDSPMTLQTVGSSDRGSLSVVYACPECGYEMAMLTNAYETQVVQSLGVRIGPSTNDAAPLAGQPEASTKGGCPFSAMISPTPHEQSTDFDRANERQRVSHANGAGPGVPASERVGGSGGAKPPGSANEHERGGGAGGAQPPTVRWTQEAEARLARVPEFVRPMARTGIERFARERGASEVDEQMLDAAREFFGM